MYIYIYIYIDISYLLKSAAKLLSGVGSFKLLREFRKSYISAQEGKKKSGVLFSAVLEAGPKKKCPHNCSDTNQET